MARGLTRGRLGGRGGVLGRGVLALVAGALLVACGPPPPPDAVEGAAVGHVLVRGDEPISSIGGPAQNREGAVFAIPAADLAAVWRESPSGGEPFSDHAMAEGYFQTSAQIVRDVGGAFAPLDEDGVFILDLAGGEHLVCFTRSPGDDNVAPDGCALATLPDPPVQLRVWTGESVTVEQVSP